MAMIRTLESYNQPQVNLNQVDSGNDLSWMYGDSESKSKETVLASSPCISPAPSPPSSMVGSQELSQELSREPSQELSSDFEVIDNEQLHSMLYSDDEEEEEDEE